LVTSKQANDRISNAFLIAAHLFLRSKLRVFLKVLLGNDGLASAVRLVRHFLVLCTLILLAKGGAILICLLEPPAPNEWLTATVATAFHNVIICLGVVSFLSDLLVVEIETTLAVFMKIRRKFKTPAQ
jgi:hypothetical protein